MKLSQALKMVLVLLLWGLLKSEGPSDPFEHSSVVLHLIGFSALPCLHVMRWTG